MPWRGRRHRTRARASAPFRSSNLYRDSSDCLTVPITLAAHWNSLVLQSAFRQGLNDQTCLKCAGLRCPAEGFWWAGGSCWGTGQLSRRMTLLTLRLTETQFTATCTEKTDWICSPIPYVIIAYHSSRTTGDSQRLLQPRTEVAAWHHRVTDTTVNLQGEHRTGPSVA